MSLGDVFYSQYSDFLPDDILKKLDKEYIGWLGQNYMGKDYTILSSHKTWSADRKIGIIGSCFSINLSPPLVNEIVEYIKNADCAITRTPAADYSVLINEWHPLSGTSLHNEDEAEWTLSLSLSKQWDCNMGGLNLIATPEGDFLGNLPIYNHAYIMKRNLARLTTTVSPLATKPLVELEVIALKKEISV